MECVAPDSIVLSCIPSPVAMPHQTFDAEDEAENTYLIDFSCPDSEKWKQVNQVAAPPCFGPFITPHHGR